MSKIVESLHDRGIIKESQIQEMEDFYSMVKESGWFSKMTGKARPYMSSVGLALASGIPAAVVIGTGTALAGVAENRAQKKQLGNSFASVMSDSHIRSNPESARTVFKQVASIAPTVASNPMVMKHMMPDIINNGLNTEKIMAITQLEKNINVGSSARGGVSALAGHIKSTSEIYGAALGEAAKSEYNRQMDHNTKLKQRGKDSERYEAGYEAGKQQASGGSQGPTPSSTTSSTSPSPKAPSSGPVIVGAEEALVQSLVLLAKRDGIGPRSFRDNDLSTIDGMNRTLFAIKSNEAGYSEMVNKLNKKYKGNATAEGLKLYRKSKGMDKKAAFLGEVIGSEYLIKTAVSATKPFSLAKSLNGLAVAGAIGIGFGVVEELASLASQKRTSNKLKTSWEETKKRLKAMPEDRGNWQDNKQSLTGAQDAFKVLMHLAPGLAENPILAASFVNTVMGQKGQIDSATVKTLTESQKNYENTHSYHSPFKQSPFFTAAQQGFSTGGGTKMVDSIAKGISTEG